MKLYEGLFLLNSAESKRDWDALYGHVSEILGKHNAEIIQESHWDDRRLAYEISGQKRGTYLLVFFKLEPTEVASLRRDCQLSETIMRQLFIRHEGDAIPAFATLGQEHSARGRHDSGGDRRRRPPRERANERKEVKPTPEKVETAKDDAGSAEAKPETESESESKS